MARGRFFVYVVELDPTGLKNVGKGAVYVGETQLTPDERFQKHKDGGLTASRKVATRGIRLRPDLYPPEGPVGSRREALRLERRTANRLRHRGYRVYGGQGKPFMSSGVPGRLVPEK